MPPISDRPTTLLITRNFPPLTGGMERLIYQTAQGLSEYTELTVVGPSECRAHCPDGATVYEAPPGLIPFLVISAWHIVRVCRKKRFKLIIGGSGLVAPALLLSRNLSGAKTLLFLHGLDLVVKNTVYQRAFIPCIRKVDQVIANSQNTLQVAIAKGVPKEHITVVNPGTHLPDINELEPRDRFLKRKNIGFSKVLIFVGRITRRKGLSGFIQNCLPTILESEPDTCLLVVGENPNQGLTNLGEGNDVAALVSKLKLGERVIFLGKVSEDDLKSCYAAAQAQVFPLIDVPGDVEGFGMVAIEAAACGTPTVAFSTGGVADAVSEENGALIKPERYDLFAEAVIRIMRDGRPTPKQCKKHAELFSWKKYNEKIKTVISSID